MYKRLQPLREEEGRPDQAGSSAISLVADATAASHTDPASDPEALQLCFNGGQVGCSPRSGSPISANASPAVCCRDPGCQLAYLVVP